MKKDILINEEGTEVTLSLSLTRRVMVRDPKMIITTPMAQAMLENHDFKLDKCLVSDIIDNYRTNSKHDGTWKFSLVKEMLATSEDVLNNEDTRVVKKKASSKKKKK